MHNLNLDPSLIVLPIASPASVAFESVCLGIHEAAVDSYRSIANNDRLRQQILWFFASILDWPKSRRLVQLSAVVMSFCKEILDSRNKLVTGNTKTGGKGSMAKVRCPINFNYNLSPLISLVLFLRTR